MKRVTTVLAAALLMSASSLFAQNTGADFSAANDNEPEKSAAMESESAEIRREPEKTAKPKKEKKVSESDLPKTIEISTEVIKLYLDGGSGFFGMYALPEQGKPIPVLAKYDGYASSYFTALINGKEYKLARSNGMKTEARKTPEGGQLAYLIPGQMQIVIDFSFVSSVPNATRLDMVRVSAFAINLSNKIIKFSLKGVFDTMLGENYYTHFSSAAHSKINRETQIKDMSDDVWIRSSDGSTSIQFLVKGKEISETEAVTLGNKDTLNLPAWVPNVVKAKSFNSVKSYNNSAVAINWPSSYIDSFKTSTKVFYLAVATDGNVPPGKQFLSFMNAGKIERYTIDSPVNASAVIKTGKDEWEDEEPESKIIQIVTIPAPVTEEIIREFPPEEAPKPQVVVPPVSTGSVFDVTDAQLDPEYIQSLLDHIQALENSDEQVDVGEIDRLNVELDTILEALRKQ